MENHFKILGILPKFFCIKIWVEDAPKKWGYPQKCGFQKNSLYIIMKQFRQVLERGLVWRKFSHLDLNFTKKTKNPIFFFF